MQKLKAHLNDVDETYFEHLIHAAGFGVAMIVGGFACLAHAIFPFAFVTTGSETIHRLYDRMVVNRTKSTNSVASTSTLQ